MTPPGIDPTTFLHTTVFSQMKMCIVQKRGIHPRILCQTFDTVVVWNEATVLRYVVKHLLYKCLLHVQLPDTQLVTALTNILYCYRY
jgi:hypothetical protein